MDNNYKDVVFLSRVLSSDNYTESRVWKEHQEMQMNFLSSRGLSSDSVILDVGCGPLSLGVALIPKLVNGWYYGLDINSETLMAGRKVLSDHGIKSERYSLICSDNFCTESVDKSVDIAFSNSLFSHLSLNSILKCLIQVRASIKETGVYYSTFFLSEGRDWLSEIPRKKWGGEFNTFPDRDPYHYSAQLLTSLATEARFTMSIEDNFGHPTQTMACFTPI